MEESYILFLTTSIRSLTSVSPMGQTCIPLPWFHVTNGDAMDRKAELEFHDQVSQPLHDSERAK